MGLVDEVELQASLVGMCFNPCYSGNGFGSLIGTSPTFFVMHCFNPCYSGNGFGSL